MMMSMPEEFINSHVKAAAADPLDTTASTIMLWRGLSRANIPATKLLKSRRVFSGSKESDPTGLR